MSYKTSPIANRLKLAKGWKVSSFPQKKIKYTPEVIQGLKIYLILKAFLYMKQIKLVSCEVRKIENNIKVVILTIHKPTLRKIRKKKKSLTKRDVRIKLTRIKTKKAINLLYQNVTSLKKLSPHRFSVVKKHPFINKWILSTIIYRNLKKKKRLVNFLKKKRTKNKNLFQTKRKLIDTTTGSVSFLKQKYRILLNRARYYKTFANYTDKIYKIKKKMIYEKTKGFEKIKPNFFAFLKCFQKLMIDSSLTSIKYLTEAAVLAQRMRKEYGILPNKYVPGIIKERICLVKKMRKLKYIFKEAKISLTILKKSQKYRSFYKKDLLKLIILKSKKRYGIRNKRRYFFDLFSTNLLGSKLNSYTSAFESICYTKTKLIKPQYNQRTLLNKLNNTKKKKQLRNFLKLSLILRKHARVNIKKPKKNEKLSLKKQTLYRSKKKVIKKKANWKLKTVKTLINSYYKKNEINKDFGQLGYLKYLRIITNYRVKILVEDFLNDYLKTTTLVKVVNYIENYKNSKLKNKIYQNYKNTRKNKQVEVMKKKKQKFLGNSIELQLLEKKKKNFIKTVRKTITLKVGQINKQQNFQKFFKKYTKKLYLKKITTIFKKTTRVVIGPNPWEKSEEDIYKQIQQIRAENLKKNQVLARLVPILMISNKMLDAQILADQIAFEFEKTKNHWPLISTIESALSVIRFKKLKGFRIGITGKINSASRTRAVFISKGNLPVQSFSERLNFAVAQARARTGAFGIRVWFYF